jgi:hypothetical protein
MSRDPSAEIPRSSLLIKYNSAAGLVKASSKLLQDSQSGSESATIRPLLSWKRGLISKHISDLGTNKNMAMGCDWAQNKE